MAGLHPAPPGACSREMDLAGSRSPLDALSPAVLVEPVGAAAVDAISAVRGIAPEKYNAGHHRPFCVEWTGLYDDLAGCVRSRLLLKVT